MALQLVKNQAADYLLTKCLNPMCGHVFYSRNPIFITGNSRDVSIKGTRVPCERCGSEALQQDWEIDSDGRFQLHELLTELRNEQLAPKLKEFKGNFEAANDTVSGEDLADVLEQVEPKFARFRQVLSNLSPKAIELTVTIILTIITIQQCYLMSESNELASESNELQEKELSIQERQLKLEEEKLDFERHKLEVAKEEAALASKVAELESTLDELTKSPERDLPPLSSTNYPPKVKTLREGTRSLKGSLRNKPCPCGSGLKAKKCHPQGV